MSQFMRRRWNDFRNGHSIYLSFVISMVNFVLIAYNFQVDSLGIFPNIYVFALAAGAVYIPVSTLFGMMHRRYQSHVDQTLGFEQNPALARAIALIMKIQTGQADPKDVDAELAYLEKIGAKK